MKISGRVTWLAPLDPPAKADPWQVPVGEHVTVLPEDMPSGPIAYTVVPPGGFAWTFPATTPTENEAA